MLAILPLATLVLGIAMIVRLSSQGARGAHGGLMVSPVALAITLLSAGCLVTGEIVAHVFPIGIDHTAPLSGGPFDDIMVFGPLQTVALGLAYGGMLLLASAPFLLLFMAATRFSRRAA